MKRTIILLGVLVSVFVTYQTVFAKRKVTYFKQDIQVGVPTDPTSFDPRMVIEGLSQSIITPLFEGLMRLDSEGNVENGITEEYSVNEDKTIYTFHLKKTYWSNGEPLTARHFEKSWKRIISPEFPTKAIFYFNIIKNAELAKKNGCPIDDIGTKALDDYTLEVTLEHPAAYFLEMLTNPCFSPAHDANEAFFSTHRPSSVLISNGPFCFNKWHPNHSIVFKKNEHYWDAENVSLETLSFSIIPDQSTALHLFERGKLDYLDSTSIPIESIPDLKKKKMLKNIDSLKMELLFVNMNEFPLNNVNFRKALSLAIDRPYIAKYFYHNGETPASNIIPRKLQLLDPTPEEFSLKAAQASLQKAMEEMNLTPNTLPQIVVKGSPTTHSMQLLQIIQEQWRKNLGLDVKIEILDFKLLIEDITTQKFQIAFLSWVSLFNDPIYNLYSLYSQISPIGWRSDDYAKILELSNHTVDLVERRELLKQAILLTQEEMPIIPLFDSSNYFLLNNRVENIVFNAYGNPVFTYAKANKRI